LRTSVLGLKVTELNTSLSIRPAAREVVGYILLGFGAILERKYSVFFTFFGTVLQILFPADTIQIVTEMSSTTI
jgi:hypothetical protein